MKSFVFRRNNSIKINWITTYITLFLLPVIIYGVMFIVIDGRIKNEANKSNFILLKQIQQYMDTLVGDTERLAINFAFNDRVQSIRSMEGNLSPEDRFKLIDLHKDLGSKVKNNPAIEDIYIYFKKIDTVVNNNNIMDSDLFLKVFCENNDIDENEWKKVNNDIHRGNYINLKVKDPNSTKKDRKLAFILSIPDYINNYDDANIIIIIDKSKLLEMSKDFEALSRGKMAIIDIKNEIILSSGRISELEKIKFEDHKEGSVIVHDNDDNKKVAITYINSKIKKWKYIYAMPVAEYWKTLEQFRRIINIGVILSVIVGCFAVYLLFKKNYKPISKLLSALPVYKNKSSEKEQNEFNVIINAITESLEEKKEIEQWISSQKEVLRCRYIERLFKSNLIDYELNDKEMLDTSFNFDYFVVVSFYIGSLEKFNEDSSTSVLESFKLLQFVIHNMMGDLIGSKGSVFTIDSDNNIVSLINLESSNQEMLLHVKETCLQVQEMIKKFYKFSLTVVISNIYSEINLINKAYKETVELIEYSEMVGGDNVLVYGEVNNSAPYKYYYPLEYEQALIVAAKVGDFSKIHLIISEIFDNNLKGSCINNNLVRCLKFNLIGTVTNIVNELADMYGDSYFTYLVLVEQMVKEKNINKIKESLLIILKEICEKIECHTKTGCQIGDKVMDYIKANYKDENLNLTIIAQAFDMNPAYLSRQFKMQTSFGVLDYIASVRVEEAKKILRDENDNLEIIAKNVGYSNARTFTRAFMKIEGITPGKYKCSELAK